LSRIIIIVNSISRVLQCGLCVLYILHGLTYEKSGHKASTYRQIEHYPDPKRRGPIAAEGFVLLAIVDPFINKRINHHGIRQGIRNIEGQT
jgi:hypothetical protein